ncbi:hypothetical protein QBC42DRAFT_264446 [Cladorrhinum samala]|uniref:MICOS complex subunit MIC12 n=1 Tax=Cladorrhinum samala TaxID=585594 RepID=A0AAV9HVF8_9PEZI|nr:hypothetical protein QBC42DRAFT_264446 [Cladorrhinum samala]
MGFIRRVVGGTALTAGLTVYYLSSRIRQSSSSSSATADSVFPSSRPQRIINPDGTYVPQSTLQSTTSQFIESIKSRWNAEVISLVKWAQGTDWDAVKVQSQDSAIQAAHLAKERGTELGTELSRQGETTYYETKRWAKQAGRQAYEGAVELEKKALLEYHELEKKAEKVVEQVRDSEKGLVQRGKEVLGKAKAALYLAEEKAEAKVEAKLLGTSEIEKILNERYDLKKREDRLDRSVEETLAERYESLEKREHRLRGL